MARRKSRGNGSVLYFAAAAGGALLGFGTTHGLYGTSVGAGIFLLAAVGISLWRH